ncbi:MAG TPA: CcoQ/FixQ family Cbb3-type cytochrome c oxidase assembly chaperone [Thiobacillaceae bacterium]|nr:CcoQ/FixQ family Cbb3-type cytochrome c oxidase assembly chaperone [Thiobacillaceae bacterium]
MDGAMINAVLTVVFFLTFGGIVWWAYGKDRKQRFENDAQIPLLDDEAVVKGDKQ